MQVSSDLLQSVGLGIFSCVSFCEFVMAAFVICISRWLNFHRFDKYLLLMQQTRWISGKYACKVHF